jgi:hypothetical protein
MVALLSLLPAAAELRAEPKAISIHPFIGQRGTDFSVTVRGNGLKGTTSVSVGGGPFTVAIEGARSEPADEASSGKKAPIDLVQLRVHATPETRPGRYPIRLITPGGISNALPLTIVDLPVAAEPAGTHDTRDSAVAVSKLPAFYAGRLERRGETDYYAFHATAGETMTFEVISGLPQIAAAGSAATIPNFDPAITIYEPSGSWFDPARLNRIAYNDEPQWVSGKGTDAYLVHRFTKEGEYLLRIEAFAGQGGPDYSYELKIAPGVHPQSGAGADEAGEDEEGGGGAGWQERAWTRRLDTQRLNELGKRGGKDDKQPALETYRAAAEPVLFKTPGIIEGIIGKPGEIQRARFHLDKPADVAVEVETPGAAPPYFNPMFRVLGPAGIEVASNVMAGKGACTGAMTKSLQAKTILPLRDTGDYTIEVRDATANLAGADFRFRLQVRPQIPHVGQVRVIADALNLARGQSKAIRVMFDREEDFRDVVTVAAESLPPGVSAVAAADFEAEPDRPRTGKPERYVGRTERVVVAFTAAADAPASTEPHDIRLVIRPLVNNKTGDALLSKTIPMMVIEKP